MKTLVEITETLRRVVEVHHDENVSPCEIEDFVKDRYCKEEIILLADDFCETEFDVIEEEDNHRYHPQQSFLYSEVDF